MKRWERRWLKKLNSRSDRYNEAPRSKLLGIMAKANK
jgi:hypothetical protein